MTLGNPFASLFSSGCGRSTGRGRNGNRTRLWIELMEDRQLLSTVLPETSQSAPAIITFQDQVTNQYAPYIAWTGTDDHLNIENLSTGAKTTLPETSFAAPALAVFHGSLFIAWTGTDSQHHLNLESSTDGMTFSNKTILNETTPYFDGPALAPYIDALCIAWTGTDYRLNYAYVFDVDIDPGEPYTVGPAHTLQYCSFTSPSLDTFNGDFTISWTADNRKLNSFSITYQVLETPRNIPNYDSDSAPSVATDDGFPGRSVIGYAWTQSNSAVDGDVVYAYSLEFGLKNLGSSRPYTAPSLAVDYLPDCHNFYIAWIGADDYLNYDVLDASGPYQGLTSQYTVTQATPNGQLNVARTGSDHQSKVVDQANGIRNLGGPVNVTSQTTPSVAANRDLYFAATHLNTQVQIRDVNETAVRDTHELSHDGPSRAIDVAGMRRIGGTGTEDAFGPFCGNLNYEAV